MLILSLESTAAMASAALWRDGSLCAQYTLQSGNTHSTTLLPMAETILRNASLRASDIDLFACTIGPGSFTGVRIGAATIKGLAFGTGKPCVGVSSVEALAWGMRGVNGIVCPLISARRTQYYSALFRICGGEVTRLTEDDIVLDADLPALLAAYDEPIYLCGDGYTAAWRESLHPLLQYTPEMYRHPSAFAAAECAAKIYANAADKSAFTDASLNPIYLRKTQAEREREERLAAQNV